MRVDFYQLSRGPVERELPPLARRVLETGERLLVVSADTAQLGRIDEGLWAGRESFLAHGRAGEPHQERQPILLADQLEPANGARFVALADGRWRDEAERFERVFLFFDLATIDDARATWRRLKDREGMERNYWQQQDKGWTRAG
ncbi:DNA polymerase III subunit chi [Novosphingobium sp.]|uniref:DNA polymerase III subunit chi n=1 Tax=Novosphingobium sp. TaxID=1874826 RepID=UPI001EC0433B|nr:DNA polymerase III subunit chi [Novosphingobium sp.]MBK9010325.1 DNA polymerase III subunit chi [Novosphingobium sp.]